MCEELDLVLKNVFSSERDVQKQKLLCVPKYSFYLVLN